MQETDSGEPALTVEEARRTCAAFLSSVENGGGDARETAFFTMALGMLPEAEQGTILECVKRAKAARQEKWLAEARAQRTGDDWADYHACPVDFSVCADDYASLEELAQGWVAYRTGEPPEEWLSRFLAWRDGSGGLGKPFRAEHPVAIPQPWLIAEDQSPRWRVPKGRRGLDDAAKRDAYARRWRESHASLRGREVVVFLPPGRQLCFAIVGDRALTQSEADDYLWDAFGAGSEPRFLQVSYPFYYPTDEEGVALTVHLGSSAPKPKSLADRQARQATTITGRPTGISALDRVLSGGYLPSDALVGIGGAYEQCKTTTTLEMLENLATEPGTMNVLLALDEPAIMLRARRLQRRGLSREAARAAVTTATETTLTAGVDLSVITAEPGELFEDFLAQVLAEADGRQVTLAIDSIQKLDTRAGAGKDSKARVTAASQAVRAAIAAGRGRLRILFTSEVVPRSGTLKDSSSLGFDADLILLTSKNQAEDGLTLNVVKNRYGDKAKLSVGLDRAAQRLGHALRKPSKRGAPATLRDKVWAVLVEQGTTPGSDIAEAVGARKAEVLALLRKCRDAGELTHGPEGYGLPGE